MKIVIQKDNRTPIQTISIPFDFEEQEVSAIQNIVDMITSAYVTDTCWRCSGKGTIVNPAVDGFSTMDECAQDAEFMDNYFSGVYDIVCHECNGFGILNMSEEAVEARMQRHEDEAVYRAEMRLMGEY